MVCFKVFYTKVKSEVLLVFLPHAGFFMYSQSAFRSKKNNDDTAGDSHFKPIFTENIHINNNTGLSTMINEKKES